MRSSNPRYRRRRSHRRIVARPWYTTGPLHKKKWANGLYAMPARAFTAYNPYNNPTFWPATQSNGLKPVRATRARSDPSIRCCGSGSNTAFTADATTICVRKRICVSTWNIASRSVSTRVSGYTVRRGSNDWVISVRRVTRAHHTPSPRRHSDVAYVGHRRHEVKADGCAVRRGPRQTDPAFGVRPTEHRTKKRRCGGTRRRCKNAVAWDAPQTLTATIHTETGSHRDAKLARDDTLCKTRCAKRGWDICTICERGGVPFCRDASGCSRFSEMKSRSWCMLLSTEERPTTRAPSGHGAGPTRPRGDRRCTALAGPWCWRCRSVVKTHNAPLSVGSEAQRDRDRIVIGGVDHLCGDAPGALRRPTMEGEQGVQHRRPEVSTLRRRATPGQEHLESDGQHVEGYVGAPPMPPRRRCTGDRRRVSVRIRRCSACRCCIAYASEGEPRRRALPHRHRGAAARSATPEPVTAPTMPLGFCLRKSLAPTRGIRGTATRWSGAVANHRWNAVRRARTARQTKTCATPKHRNTTVFSWMRSSMSSVPRNRGSGHTAARCGERCTARLECDSASRGSMS